MQRLKRQPGNCAARSINCKRRLKNRTAISKPHEKKRKPSTRVCRKQVPSSANAQKEIETSKESERQARDQLAQTQASQENSTTEQLRAQIADLRKEVALAEEARATAKSKGTKPTRNSRRQTSKSLPSDNSAMKRSRQLKAGSETEQAARRSLPRISISS